MRVFAPILLLSGILVLTGNGLYSQDKKDDSTPKVRTSLPPGWGKLNLTGEQKQNIYKVQEKYKGDIKKLEDKIADLKSEEKKEMVKVLTPEQKQKLQEQVTGEKPAK